MSGSPPPFLAATKILRQSLLNSLPRLASTAPLRCAMFAEWECPAIVVRPTPGRVWLDHPHVREDRGRRSDGSDRDRSPGRSMRFPDLSPSRPVPHFPFPIDRLRDWRRRGGAWAGLDPEGLELLADLGSRLSGGLADCGELQGFLPGRLRLDRLLELEVDVAKVVGDGRVGDLGESLTAFSRWPIRLLDLAALEQDPAQAVEVSVVLGVLGQTALRIIASAFSRFLP